MRQAAANGLVFLVVGLLLIVSFGVYQHNFAPTVPSGSVTVDGVAVGRNFAPVIATTFADAWLVAATNLESGKSVADAQKALQSSWQTNRGQAFAQLVAPEFSKVLPEGSEPTTPTDRAATVRLWRDFAAGLRKGVGK